MTKQPAFAKAGMAGESTRIGKSREPRITRMTRMLAGFSRAQTCRASVSDAKSRWIGLSSSRWLARSTRWAQRVLPRYLLSAIDYQLLLRNFNVAGRMRSLSPQEGWLCYIFALIRRSRISAQPKITSYVTASGYKAVRVHYGPLNQMIMSVQINGQLANLLVDTARSKSFWIQTRPQHSA